MDHPGVNPCTGFGAFNKLALGSFAFTRRRNSPSGYVWRDTFPGDLVCVAPAERAAAKASAPPPSSAQTPLRC